MSDQARMFDVFEREARRCVALKLNRPRWYVRLRFRMCLHLNIHDLLRTPVTGRLCCIWCDKGWPKATSTM